MNGIHDMGGMDGFGAVVPEAGEPVFHAEWEKRMFAIAAAVPFALPFADDHLRREIERIPPVVYLGSSYYELWYHAIMALLAERNAFSPAGPQGANPPLQADAVDAAILAGATTRMAAPHAVARFQPGDAVVTRNINPHDHTRLPRYARGRHGAILRNHGTFSFADSNARGDGPSPQHLYAVRFTAQELWGPDASRRDDLVLDLWDAYLEPAS
ncbi:MAG: nitrile hydratase subunit beta [Rhodospirillaceae bacterium]|nr:nitrile hydratase subunit beta [Rhodospirillaceae bacterium]